jgi:hypothetical protein
VILCCSNRASMTLMLNLLASEAARRFRMTMYQSRFLLRRSLRHPSLNPARSRRPTHNPLLNRNPRRNHNRRPQQTSLSRAGTHRCRTTTILTRLASAVSMALRMDPATACRSTVRIQRTLHTLQAGSSHLSRRCSNLVPTRATHPLRPQRDPAPRRATHTRRTCTDTDTVSVRVWVSGWDKASLRVGMTMRGMDHITDNISTS